MVVFTLAQSTLVDDVMRSMDIAVGTVFVVALIFIAIKKTNSPPADSDTEETEPPR